MTVTSSPNGPSDRRAVERGGTRDGAKRDKMKRDGGGRVSVGKEGIGMDGQNHATLSTSIVEVISLLAVTYEN